MSLPHILLIASILISVPGDISMMGIKIKDSRESTKNINLDVVARDTDMIKYRTENGNDLSITFENNKVVYMENDWLQDTAARQPLFSDFSFGQTTLKEIRSKFGTNGFVHKKMGSIKTETDVIMFNCFEFDSKNNEVLVTITKARISEDVTQENVASMLKLDALIIADKAYLDKIWGKEKLCDPNYKKIEP
jgi:hypothetical protein